MSALLNLDEHRPARVQCLRVWDNGDSWWWSCSHQFPMTGVHGRICGRESYGFVSEREAVEAAKTHHWAAHSVCEVPA